jgi:hypothetical protein
MKKNLCVQQHDLFKRAIVWDTLMAGYGYDELMTIIRLYVLDTFYRLN